MTLKSILYHTLGSALLLGVCLPVLCSCEEEDTYAELRKTEGAQISNFLNYGTRVVDKETGDVTLDVPAPIKVISESEFYANDTTTNVEENEYVLLAGSGVYMQIIREGVGERLQDDENCSVLCRYTELNIASDTIQSSNTLAATTEEKYERMNVRKANGLITAEFTVTEPLGIMYTLYGSSVPSGWIHPLQFIKLGRQNSEEGEVAKVRIIVPSTEGQRDALNNIYPCFYEITYTKGR